MKKKFVLLIAILLMSFATVAPTTVNAQSGEGVDVCTYYYANGFKSWSSCNTWYTNRQLLLQPAWQTKIGKCMLKSGITASAPAFAKELKKSPKVIMITYGLSVLACLF